MSIKVYLILLLISIYVQLLMVEMRQILYILTSKCYFSIGDNYLILRVLLIQTRLTLLLSTYIKMVTESMKFLSGLKQDRITERKKKSANRGLKTKFTQESQRGELEVIRSPFLV